MVVEEDPDLEALRLAALSSLKKKKNHLPSLEEESKAIDSDDETAALREAALQTLKLKKQAKATQISEANKNNQPRSYNSYGAFLYKYRREQEKSSARRNLVVIPTQDNEKTKSSEEVDQSLPKIRLPQDKYVGQRTPGKDAEDESKSSRFGRRRDDSDSSDDDIDRLLGSDDETDMQTSPRPTRTVVSRSETPSPILDKTDTSTPHSVKPRIKRVSKNSRSAKSPPLDAEKKSSHAAARKDKHRDSVAVTKTSKHTESALKDAKDKKAEKSEFKIDMFEDVDPSLTDSLLNLSTTPTSPMILDESLFRDRLLKATLKTPDQNRTSKSSDYHKTQNILHK